MRENIGQQFSFERIASIVTSDELAKKLKDKRLVHYDVNCLMCNVVFCATENILTGNFV
jgi:hypothetical protein